MGRSRSSGSRFSSSSSKPAAAPARAPAPAPSTSTATATKPTPQAAPQAPAPQAPQAPQQQFQNPMMQQQQPSGGGGMLSGIMGGIVQGMAFGTGSAIANRAVDSVMGPRTVVHEHQGAPQAAPAQSGGKCGDQLEQFNSCMKTNNNDINQCNWFMEQLTSCQKQ